MSSSEDDSDCWEKIEIEDYDRIFKKVPEDCQNDLDEEKSEKSSVEINDQILILPTKTRNQIVKILENLSINDSLKKTKKEINSKLGEIILKLSDLKLNEEKEIKKRENLNLNLETSSVLDLSWESRTKIIDLLMKNKILLSLGEESNNLNDKLMKNNNDLIGILINLKINDQITIDEQNENNFQPDRSIDEISLLKGICCLCKLIFL